MATVKLRLKDKTFLTRGVDDRNLDRANIRGIVTALTNDDGGGNDPDAIRNSAITEAITSAQTNGENFHNELTDLPLASVSAIRFGINKALVDLDYRRLPSSKPRWNSFDFAEETQAGFEHRIQWQITENAFPTDCPEHVGNPELGSDFAVAVRARASIRQIVVTTRLADVPEVETAPVYNHMNSDAVLINGQVRNPKTLHYEGMNVRPYDTHTGIFYAIQYVFRYNAFGWINERLVQEYKDYRCTNHTLNWYALKLTKQDRDRFFSTPFAGKFPTHTGVHGPSVTDPSGGLPEPAPF